MRYEQQGDYFFPCVMTNEQKNLHIGVWANRHRQYLKQFHQVRYYNLFTSEKLYEYLADIEEQAEKMFEELVKSLAEGENVTEKLKADKPTRYMKPFEIIDRGIARQGYPIEDAEGNEIGVVCSGTVSPLTGKSIGTGYVKSGFHKLDSEIFIRVRNKALKAKIVKTPFF